MKTLTLALLLVGSPALAQTPAAPDSAPQPREPSANPPKVSPGRTPLLAGQPLPAVRSNTPATSPTTITAPLPRVTPRPLPPLSSNTIVVPSGAGADSQKTNSIVVPDAAGAAPAGAPGTGAAAQDGAETGAATGADGNATTEPLNAAGFINFPATDLNQVLDIYAKLVNRTVLRPTTLPAPQITLRTQTPLTTKEAIEAFDAVLGMNGITMVNIGDKFVKAVATADAGTVGGPFSKLTAQQYPELGPFVTHVVQLKYAKPSETTQVLQPFSKTPNAILAIDSSQILVLRDYSENVKRMLQMIKEIDVAVPSDYESEVIPIKYAQATDIANALNSLSSGGGGGATVGSAGTGGRRGGGARGGIGGMGRSGIGGYGGGYGGLGGSYGGYGGGYGGSYGGSYGGVTPYATTTPVGTTPGTQNSFTDRLRGILNKATSSDEIQVLGKTKMIADERTNSLLIFASKDDLKRIKDVVAKLDVVLAQVLIEAYVIEVTLTDSQNLGVSYLQKQPSSLGSYFKGIGAINNGNLLSQGSFLAGAGTNAAGNLPGGFSYLGSLGQDLDVALTAVAEDSHARILQRPRIQTSHNEPATLFVGQTVPYPSSSYYGGGAFGGYASIQQVPIGVTLTVTPLINPDGLVVMDISADIQSENGTVSIANVGDVPITSQKSASAKVSVRDHDTIMLGGLIETSKSKSLSGVPILMNIPLLGYLFRSTSDKSDRDEMIVLIRPTVLPTPEVAALNAKAEQNRMPLIKDAQKDIDKDEQRRLKHLDKPGKKEPEFEPVEDK